MGGDVGRDIGSEFPFDWIPPAARQGGMSDGATGLCFGRGSFRTAMLLTSASLACWVVACGSSRSTGGAGGTGAGNGGSVAMGGMTGSGGAPSSGGTPATGGAIGSGGIPATGGANSSGGTIATGGTSGTADAALGGSPGAGGALGAGGGTGSGDMPNAFTLTSPSLSEGDAFLPDNTCAGANTSPELDWTAGPAATMSYAMVLTDLSNGFLHWVVWDMPPETRSLPAMLPTTATLTDPAGARQVALSGTGYTGPCPSGNVHNYQFAIHALDVATLPGLAANPTTTQVTDAVTTHSLAQASLGGTSNARRP
jgi:Raf kinase inhibitor-like YbhB/YbcL family protein